MFVLTPLKRPPILLLWSALVAGGIGEELRRVALVWIAVDMIGKDAAYVTAAQAGALMVFSLVGGVYADRWDHRRTLMAVDLARAVISALLALAAAAGTLGLTSIFAATIALSMLTALYTPSVQACLPRLAEGADMMHALNGLIDGSRRLARILGPALVGVLAAIVPTHHFFTLNVLTFIGSALAVAALIRALPPMPSTAGPALLPLGAVAELGATLRGTLGHRLMRYTFISMLAGTAAWSATFMLCLPLLIQDVLKTDIGAYGLVISAYGAGNLAGNLLIASFPMTRPGLVLVLGRLIAGVGFAMMATASDLSVLMIGAAFAAMVGPTVDLPYLVLARRDFPAGMMGKLFSLRNLVDSAGMLLGMVAAALLLDHVGIVETIAVMAAILGAVSLSGLRMADR
jgi:MFS family permease